jgi:hypothetical protein
MNIFAIISDAISRLWRSGHKGIVLSPVAERVLQEAQARGYQISRTTRQGAEAIVLRAGNQGLVHLWSNDDVLEFGRSQNWI